MLVTFAVDSPDSLENVMEKWIGEVNHFCSDLPVILVACKKDLRNDPNTIAELEKSSQLPVTVDQVRYALIERGCRVLRKLVLSSTWNAVPRLEKE